MLDSVRRFLDEFLAPGGDEVSRQSHEHHLQLATAALLIEMTRADFSDSPGERDHVVALLQREFSLTTYEAQRISDLGAEAADSAVSLYEFTRSLNDALSHGDKVRVVEMLWQVAYADSALDKYEEHLLRKVADLLHLSHRQLVQAKLRVLQARGAQ